MQRSEMLTHASLELDQNRATPTLSARGDGRCPTGIQLASIAERSFFMTKKSLLGKSV